MSAALAAACVLTITMATAKASTVTFDLSPSHLDCPNCTIGGNIVVDTTAGTVVSVDITVTGTLPAGPFTTINGVLPEAGGTVTLLDFTDAGNTNFLHLFLPVSNLVGYAGGQYATSSIRQFRATPRGLFLSSLQDSS
jgi:hypothetical protein